MTKSFGIVCVLLLSLGKAWKAYHLFSPKKKTLAKSCIRMIQRNTVVRVFCFGALLRRNLFQFLANGCFHQSYKRISKFPSAVKIETSSPGGLRDAFSFLCLLVTGPSVGLRNRLLLHFLYFPRKRNC